MVDSTANFKVCFKVEIEIGGTEWRKPNFEALALLFGIDTEAVTEAELTEIFQRVDAISSNDWYRTVRVLIEEKTVAFDDNYHRSRHYARDFNYIVNHLPNEIKAVIEQIFVDESGIWDAYMGGPDIGSKIKKLVLAKMLKSIESRIKRRLPGSVGRPSIRSNYRYLDNKIKFVKECMLACGTLEAIGKNITRETLAETLYPLKYAEPSKALASKLKNFDLSMKELKNTYAGKGDLSYEILMEQIARTLELLG